MGFLILAVTVSIALLVSFLCSILEATLLSISAAELKERSGRGDKGAAMLLDLKQNQLDNAIGAILTLNTVAHTLGSALSGVQVGELFGTQWVGAFGAVLTVLVLVGTEIIPKTLGTAHASGLASFAGRTITLMIFSLKPLLFLTHFLTRLVSRGERRPISRGELLAMVEMAADEGTLDQGRQQVLTNVLKFDGIPISAIMTPRTVVTMISADSTLGALIGDDTVSAYSRVPVYDKGGRDDVIGYILVRDAFRAAARGADPAEPVTTWLRKIWALPLETSVDAAMRQFLDRHDPLAIVVGEHGGVSGLVTLEDVLETVLGAEIVDEFDRTADLRQLAVELRDKRLKRLEEGGRLFESTT